jgi:hypothetical protein
MQSVADWITRAKWFLIFVLLVWGTFFLPAAYTECRAEGHNNVACGISALFIAFFDVIVRVLVTVYHFFSWVLP